MSIVHGRKAAAMRRRDILAGAGSLAAGATVSFPAPAIAQGIRQLKMVTDWPEGMPGLHTSAVRFAQTIGAATGGRIKIEVFPAGALVRAFETFDAVGAGVADMYHSFEGYFEKKSPAFHFFAADALRLHRRRAVRVGPLRRRPRAVGRAQRSVQRQAAALLQHRLPDGRLVHPRDHLAGGVQGTALPDGRARRRGAPAAGRHRGDRCRAARSCQRSSPAPSTPANGSGPGSTWRSVCTRQRATTTIPGFTSRAPASRSASTRACGRASTRATGGSSRRRLPANTRAPWRSSTPTMHCRCASCATKAPSRS